MRKKIITIISVISLILILTVSLVACERDIDSLTEKLSNKGFSVTETKKGIDDEQLSFIPTKNLKWTLKATRNTENYTDVSEADILFVLQYKDQDDADVAINAITDNYTFKYKVGDQLIDFTYKRVSSYIYFGTFRAVINASNFTLYDKELKESNLFYQGYKTKADRNVGALIKDDPQLPFIVKDGLQYKITATKVNDTTHELVFMFKYNNTDLSKADFDKAPESIKYNLDGYEYNLSKKLDGIYLYIGTTTGISNAENML